MLPLAWVLGGLGVSAVAAVGKYLMDDDSNKVAVSASSTPAKDTWGKYHTMKLYLANLVFGIDGNICESEQKSLRALSVDMPEEEKNRLQKALETPDVFIALGRLFKALDDGDKQKIVDDVIDFIREDKSVSEEEEALLYQIAQIVENNEKLDLYISKSNVSEQPSHGLFNYIDRATVELNFPLTDGVFREHRIYIEHPFQEGALQIFDEEAFNGSQESFYDGLVELMKDIGARKVKVESISSDEVKNSSKVAVGADVKAKVVEVSAKGKSDFHGSDLINHSDALTLEFHGVGVGFLDRLFRGRWERRLVKKYGSNKMYQAIIRARFGENRLKFFDYQVKSKEAHKMARSLNATLAVKHKLFGAKAEAGYSSNSERVAVIDKKLTIEFW